MNLRLLFGATVFLAAFLLFLVEPIAAKQLLPILGGSASVWITCLVFFQTTLLVGYLYAHFNSRRTSWTGHIGLLGFAVAESIRWGLGDPGLASGSSHPIWAVFEGLSAWIGLPFIVLSATSPLLQVWWSRFETGHIPYRLYALSNLASLLALGLYPSLVEPLLTLHQQRVLWFWGFVVFAILSVQLTLKVRAVQPALLREEAVRISVPDESPLPKSSRFHKLLWVLLPMGAAMQLCAVTSYLTANVAAIPLLWVLPLGVYLLTLILSFQFQVVLPWGIIARLMVVMLAALAYGLAQTNHTWPLWLSLLFFLAELFFACIFCHTAACALRPQRPSEATLFYLYFAAGGALGSFIVGIALPLLTRYNLDLPITFLVTALLALAFNWRGGWNQRLLWSVASAAMVALVIMVYTAYRHDTTVAERNFYASLRVTQDHSYPGATLRTLTNGSIQHGTQIFGTDELRHTPTTYYALESGIGLALRDCCLRPDGSVRPRTIGVIGLGTGTVAAYGRPGDRIRFYEINPVVEPIARNVFTYIRDSGAQVDVVPGDARTTLAAQGPQNFDVLVVDAFSGDAIPLHLLTTQALALYRRHMAPGGIIAFHISNQHVNLGPPIALLAASAGMQARRVSTVVDPDHPEVNSPGEFSATWVLVTNNQDFLNQPEVAELAKPIATRRGLRLWTDDYSALLPVLRW
ncbi:MAG TPA: fused MFS/spermidine synthase [Terracidiphilus sp.]|nr:fused MFS/spermidine synthase [Terracidiphilus sp.]